MHQFSPAFSKWPIVLTVLLCQMHAPVPVVHDHQHVGVAFRLHDHLTQRHHDLSDDACRHVHWVWPGACDPSNSSHDDPIDESMPSIPMFSRHVGGDVMAGLGGGVNATESLDMIGLAIAPLMAGGLVRGHGDVIRGGLYRVDKTRFLGRPCAVLCIARC